MSNPAFAPKIVRARARASNLADRIDHARARDQRRALTQCRDHARGIGLSLDQVRGVSRELDLAFGNDPVLARASTRALARDLARIRADAYALDYDLGVAHDFDHVLGLDGIRASARALAVDLDRLTDSVHAIADSLEGMIADAVSEKSAVVRAATSPSARRLLRVAGLMVPAADRARYAEEFSSELSELAATGISRPSQVSYAARVTGRSVMLHRALPSPRRGPAAP